MRNARQTVLFLAFLLVSSPVLAQETPPAADKPEPSTETTEEAPAEPAEESKPPVKEKAAEIRDERILELWKHDLTQPTVAELVGRMREQMSNTERNDFPDRVSPDSQFDEHKKSLLKKKNSLFTEKTSIGADDVQNTSINIANKGKGLFAENSI